MDNSLLNMIDNLIIERAPYINNNNKKVVLILKLWHVVQRRGKKAKCFSNYIYKGAVEIK